MFFILSKIFEFLLLPMTWILILIIWGFLCRGTKRSSKLILAGIVALLIFTNPFFANKAMNIWEVPSIKASEISQPYDVAVLLGGSLRYYNSEMERPVYSASVDRLMQTIDLFKKGKIRNILLSGGSGRVMLQEEKESEIIRESLLNCGIPDSCILLENESRNTYENAVNSTKILKNKFPHGRYILITSAFHMRRSLACFEKAGVQIVPYSVDEKSGKGPWTPDRIIVPDSECMLIWDTLMHEWYGIIFYKIAGYI